LTKTLRKLVVVKVFFFPCPFFNNVLYALNMYSSYISHHIFSHMQQPTFGTFKPKATYFWICCGYMICSFANLTCFRKLNE
jgi:hypothetical protein